MSVYYRQKIIQERNLTTRHNISKRYKLEKTPSGDSRMSSLSSPIDHCYRPVQRHPETTIIDILQYQSTLVWNPPPPGAPAVPQRHRPHSRKTLFLTSGWSCLACPLGWSIEKDVSKGDGRGASPASHLLFSKLPMHSLRSPPEDPYLDWIHCCLLACWGLYYRRIRLIAGSPPISLSLIVGRSKCDAEASVTHRTFFFLPEEVT